MKQNTKQTNGNRTLTRLAAQKKKITIAVILIGVMVIMWGRILAKKNQVPGNQAVIAPQAAFAEDTQPKIKVTYVELPHVKGRNDVLARDIFAGSRWEGLGAAANGARPPKESIKNAHENLADTIEMIGKDLKLETIFSGKNPQASVGGMLVSPRSRLTVEYEGDQYEFKVVAINDNEVVLECKGVQVKLSMTRPNESAY